MSLMSFTDSGLEVRDRLWLKITIKNAFIGCDVVDWLYEKVGKGQCNTAAKVNNTGRT